jgi:hypothetical protein
LEVVGSHGKFRGLIKRLTKIDGNSFEKCLDIKKILKE